MSLPVGFWPSLLLGLLHRGGRLRVVLPGDLGLGELAAPQQALGGLDGRALRAGLEVRVAAQVDVDALAQRLGLRRHRALADVGPVAVDGQGVAAVRRGDVDGVLVDARVVGPAGVAHAGVGLGVRLVVGPGEPDVVGHLVDAVRREVGVVERGDRRRDVGVDAGVVAGGVQPLRPPGHERQRRLAAVGRRDVVVLEVVVERRALADAERLRRRDRLAGLRAALRLGGGPVGGHLVDVARAARLRADPQREHVPAALLLGLHPGRGEVRLVAEPVAAAEVDPDAGVRRLEPPRVHHGLRRRGAGVERVAGQRARARPAPCGRPGCPRPAACAGAAVMSRPVSRPPRATSAVRFNVVSFTENQGNVRTSMTDGWWVAGPGRRLSGSPGYPGDPDDLRPRTEIPGRSERLRLPASSATRRPAGRSAPRTTRRRPVGSGSPAAAGSAPCRGARPPPRRTARRSRTSSP